MPTSIDAIFENGVFRPLNPVSIAENQRVKITLEDSNILVEERDTIKCPILRHIPEAYVDD